MRLKVAILNRPMAPHYYLRQTLAKFLNELKFFINDAYPNLTYFKQTSETKFA